MAADINILVYNHDFLSDLQRDRNVIVSDIKLKFKSIDRPMTYSNRYRTLNSMFDIHPNMSLTSRARLCMSGDFSEVEELLITNNNFTFYNEFRIYNISGDIRIVEKVRLNQLNNDFIQLKSNDIRKC